MNIYIKQFKESFLKDNKNLITKFKRSLTKYNIKSIREQATEHKHNYIYFSEVKKNNDYKFNTEKQREKLFKNFFITETNPNYKGHFSESFYNMVKDFTIKEILKLYQYIDEEGKSKIKDHIKELERIGADRHDYNLNIQAQLFLFFFYETLIKEETERKLIKYLENTK